MICLKLKVALESKQEEERWRCQVRLAAGDPTQVFPGSEHVWEGA